jgi:hypothetical protein
LPDAERVRIEVAFDGGQIFGAFVPAKGADSLERALSASSEGTLLLDTEDGRISVVLSRVLYVKRYARDAQVGFGN